MQTKAMANSEGDLNPFIQKHQSDVVGVLHGFDRLRLAARLRLVSDTAALRQMARPFRAFMFWVTFPRPLAGMV